jgi:predicted nucleic acid-binding protein
VNLSVEGIPHGAVVVVDSAPIIFYLENRSRIAERFAPVFEATEHGELEIAISTITLAEVLAGPFQHGNELLAAQYERALTSATGWRVVPVNQQIAVQAARFRAVYKLRLPDAIQVATAVVVGAHALVTHDKAFARIKEMRVVGF